MKLFLKYRIVLISISFAIIGWSIPQIFHLDNASIQYGLLALLVALGGFLAANAFARKRRNAQFVSQKNNIITVLALLFIVSTITHTLSYEGRVFKYPYYETIVYMPKGEYSSDAKGMLDQGNGKLSDAALLDAVGYLNNEDLWEPTSFAMNRSIVIISYCTFIFFFSVLISFAIESNIQTIIPTEVVSTPPQPVQHPTIDVGQGKLKVFISYARESEELGQRILELATWLEKNSNDIRVEFDQLYSTTPPALGWSTWMHQSIEDAHTVLVVCTPKYKERFNKRHPDPITGKGVAFEGAIISNEIYDNQQKNEKFYPIIPDGGDSNDIPSSLKSWSNGHSFSSGNKEILDLIFRRNPKLT